MLSLQAEGEKRFFLQEKVINDLRKLATDKNVHIFLIIHPKKVDDECALNVASIFGSAKSTQEADNVMILQKHPEIHNLRTIEIKKNRYDGGVGNQPLGFNPDNKRYFEITPQEFTVMNNSNGKMGIDNLISHRKKKFDGEVEPLLKVLSHDNGRSNL
jgi:twinkle protein